jgi:hypothetical protein
MEIAQALRGIDLAYLSSLAALPKQTGKREAGGSDCTDEKLYEVLSHEAQERHRHLHGSGS